MSVAKPGAAAKPRPAHAPAALPDGYVRRVWIENVQPSVDDGRHPIKRVVGERVVVTADIFTDGHDAIAAAVRYSSGDGEWREAPMGPTGNDGWSGEFRVDSIGSARFTIAAWIDRFGSWRAALAKKFAAGQSVATDLLEGAELLAAAADRAAGEDRVALLTQARSLRASDPVDERVALALSDSLVDLADRYPDRANETVYGGCREVDVAREIARTSAWYEMFPRSATPDSRRSATFGEAEARLDEIAAMGFDVLYLPPIHPIGHTNRKGPNNVWPAPASSPGSPWAIGSEEGGHMAVHPELGTLEDFDHFRAAAARRGLEVALDLAYQCSPDHPYVREHPEWFRQRPDGTIHYAENPPKKYEDIIPFDFECADWRSLWLELRRVLFFWIERGVRIFRVDNPHTKPLRFWRWLLREARSAHPDVIFLSEAFTRPKKMYALAKLGFDSSYTYFTWRLTAEELRDYLTEINSARIREFFRPSFFTNTPDILSEYLQVGGRAAFQIRLALAATLSPAYGIYSGFEDCEAEALPGTEEYGHSEKYELRPRTPQPGNIRAFITRINAIRRANPALASNAFLRFHPVDNRQLLVYSQRTEDFSNILLIAVNLDPHHVQSGFVDLAPEALAIPNGEIRQMHDLVGDGRYLWQGARNPVRLDPAASPVQIFRLRRRARREQDFDYFT